VLFSGEDSAFAAIPLHFFQGCVAFVFQFFELGGRQSRHFFELVGQVRHAAVI
jgi:hypothetical protein